MQQGGQSREKQWWMSDINSTVFQDKMWGKKACIHEVVDLISVGYELLLCKELNKEEMKAELKCQYGVKEHEGLEDQSWRMGKGRTTMDYTMVEQLITLGRIQSDINNDAILVWEMREGLPQNCNWRLWVRVLNRNLSLMTELDQDILVALNEQV